MNHHRLQKISAPLSIAAAFALALVISTPLHSEPAAPADASSALKVVGKTIAVVNNEPIFMDELERESEPFVVRYKKTTPEKEQSAEKIAGLKKEILDRLIEEKLLLQESKNKKIRVTKVEIERGIEQFKEPFMADEAGKPRTPIQAERAFQEQLSKEGLTQDQFNKRVEEQLMKVRLIEMDVKSKVELPKDEEVRKYYDKIKAKMAGKAVDTGSAEEEADLAQISKYLERMTGEQARIRHILARAKKGDAAERAAARKKIESVQQKLKAGEDFAFLAKKYSDDPLSKDRGGDLGFVAKNDMGLPEIDTFVFGNIKEGDSSGIIETEIGYHLVKLVEKKLPHPLEFEDISEDLKNYVAQRAFTQKLENYLKGLRAKANVKINSFN